MTEAAIFVVWTFCSILFPTPDMPYLPADEMHCGMKGDTLCCEITYTMGLYCCAADDSACEDDCTDKERAGDERNALRSTELWCLLGACKWQLESYGYH